MYTILRQTIRGTTDKGIINHRCIFSRRILKRFLMILVMNNSVNN